MVVKVTVPEGNYFRVIPLEANIDEEYSKVTSNTGEGFWSLDGAQFADIMDASFGDEDEEETEENYASICLKAFGTGGDSQVHSGGSCSAGFGALAQLALAPLAYIKIRNRKRR